MDSSACPSALESRPPIRPWAEDKEPPPHPSLLLPMYMISKNTASRANQIKFPLGRMRAVEKLNDSPIMQMQEGREKPISKAAV